MAHLLSVVFKADDMRKLLESNPDKIIVRTSLEGGVLSDGKKVGYVNVEAEAVNEDEEKSLGKIGGCPVPPCG